MVATGQPSITRAVVTVTAGALVLLTGCAKAQGTSGGASTPSPVQTVTVGDNDTGRTLHVTPGSSVKVVLGSTYWTFGHSSDGGVLSLVGTPNVVPSGGCVPGQGCGTVTGVFRAMAPGTATITASRTSCGEAMRCTGDQGSYRVVVIVDG